MVSASEPDPSMLLFSTKEMIVCFFFSLLGFLLCLKKFFPLAFCFFPDVFFSKSHMRA